MNLKSIISCALIAIFFSSAIYAEEKKKKHITLIAGTHHYSPHKSMPQLKLELERLGFEVALIAPKWNPEKDKRGLPGLEILEQTDLVVLFIRWLQIEGEQYTSFMNYLKAGKPVVGLRTSNHAFNYPEDHPNAAQNKQFGKDILGSPYLIHLKGSTQLKVIESAQKHPILTGVTGSWVSPGTLYLSKLEEGATPLIQGTGKSKKTGEITNQFGTHQLEAEMTDSIAWTWKNKYGGQTFYTSLGHLGDFAEPKSMRVMINGIHWAVGIDVPSADTTINTLHIGKKRK